jgi:uncharacterized protein YndB with AHSA1/START domain
MTSASVDIAAPAEAVWALVSDLTRMGEWSPETERVEWTGGATGPSVGATFKGHNRHGSKRWTTTCTVTVAEPPRELAWDVKALGVVPVATWRYEVEAIDELSCRVTESTTDKRPGIFKSLTAVATGVKDRGAHNAANMQATLERIKAAAEPGTSAPA